MFSHGFIQSTEFVDAVIEAYDESKDNNVSLCYVGVAKLFILFGLVEYKDDTLDNDGWVLKRVNWIIERTLGRKYCISVEHVLLFCLNIVLSCPFLWSCTYKTLLAHCFWGGYSFAVRPLLKGLFTAYIDTYENRAVAPHWTALRIAAKEESVVQLQMAFASLAPAFAKSFAWRYNRAGFRAIEDGMHRAVAEHIASNLKLLPTIRGLGAGGLFCLQTAPTIKDRPGLKIVVQLNASDGDLSGLGRALNVDDVKHTMSSGVTLGLVAAHAYGVSGTISTGLPASMTASRATTYLRCAFMMDKGKKNKASTSLMASVLCSGAVVDLTGTVRLKMYRPGDYHSTEPLSDDVLTRWHDRLDVLRIDREAFDEVVGLASSSMSFVLPERLEQFARGQQPIFEFALLVGKQLREVKDKAEAPQRFLAELRELVERGV